MASERGENQWGNIFLFKIQIDKRDDEVKENFIRKNKFDLPVKVCIISVCIIIVVGFCGIGLMMKYKKNVQQQSGMFEWNKDAIKDIENSLALVKKLGITRWYQEICDKYDWDVLSEFIRQMHENKVTVYALLGSAEWGLEESAETLTEHLSVILEYNESADEAAKLDGVMLDIEPYITSQWKEDPERYMDIYVKCMQKAYDFMKNQDVRTAICIPRHYDKMGLSKGLEELIADTCDEVAVMNYGCGDETEQICTEERLARKYGKELHCILEFQEVGKHGLTEKETYRNKGLKAACEVWDEMQSEYPETDIIRDYHWTRPLYDMLGELLFTP